MNTDIKIIEACNNSLSMAQAAESLNISYHRLKREAIRLNVFRPNPSGVGIIKRHAGGCEKIPLEEILKGLHPQYQSNKLRIRLISEGIKEKKCEECEITNWLNKEVSFELHHVDGDNTNHKLENLKIICPNCHSQTSTYRARNIKK